jgi:hypothetical protein
MITAAAAPAASSPPPSCPLQSAKIFGDGVWFKTNAAALTPEGANILGLSFGLGNNLPALFVSTVSCVSLYYRVRCQHSFVYAVCLQLACSFCSAAVGSPYLAR